MDGKESIIYADVLMDRVVVFPEELVRMRGWKVRMEGGFFMVCIGHKCDKVRFDGIAKKKV